MEDLKKRKLEETTNVEIPANTSEEQLRSLLDPLAKTQLVDLLSKLGCQYPSIAEEIKSVASADPANRKLFVRGLAWNTTTETLCAAFVEHGEIEEGAVIIDKASGKSRGYGFITYKDIDSTRRALEAPSKLIDGRMAVCTLACEGVSSVSSTDVAQRKLYIGGLSPETTSEALLLFFKKHGEIEEGSVAYDKDTNKSRGFGFITYKTVEAAKKAIDDPQKMLGIDIIQTTLRGSQDGKSSPLVPIRASSVYRAVNFMARGLVEGKSITVKLADNQKNKVVPLPGGMVPVHLAAQPPHPSVGYTYPAAIAYHNQPPTAAAASPYSIQPQLSYAQYIPRKETVGHSSAPPTGLATYPYYFTK